MISSKIYQYITAGSAPQIQALFPSSQISGGIPNICLDVESIAGLSRSGMTDRLGMIVPIHKERLSKRGRRKNSLSLIS